MIVCPGLGVGRAPGTDQRTALALRRTLQGDIDDFPKDVLELIAYMDDPKPGQPVRAMHESLNLRRFRQAWVQAMLPFRMPRRG